MSMNCALTKRKIFTVNGVKHLRDEYEKYTKLMELNTYKTKNNNYVAELHN